MFGNVLPLGSFCALHAQNFGSLILNGLHGEMQLKFSPSSRACGLLVGGSTNRKEILYAGSSRCSLLLGLRTSYHRSDASRNLPAWYMLLPPRSSRLTPRLTSDAVVARICAVQYSSCLPMTSARVWSRTGCGRCRSCDAIQVASRPSRLISCRSPFSCPSSSACTQMFMIGRLSVMASASAMLPAVPSSFGQAYRSALPHLLYACQVSVGATIVSACGPKSSRTTSGAPVATPSDPAPVNR